MPTQENLLVTAKKLADLLSIKEKTVEDLTRKGVIPCVRLSPRVIRYDPGAVLRKLKGNEKKAANEAAAGSP
jgi:predicted site-specific integrase-resolvase